MQIHVKEEEEIQGKKQHFEACKQIFSLTTCRTYNTTETETKTSVFIYRYSGDGKSYARSSYPRSMFEIL